MKRFFKGIVLILTLLAVSFNADASLSVTVKWNVPGALKIFVGGSGESYRVDLGADQTEYVATIDNTWGSTYLAKSEGYEIESVVIDGTHLIPMYNGMYSIDMTRYDGKTVEVTLEKVEYDKFITVNVINGREALKATMWGTGREINFSTGQQQIAYSSKFETGIDIQALAEGSENPYITQNGVEKEWKTYYTWDNYLYHLYDEDTNLKGFGFDEGTDFEIKYCETEDAPEAEPSVITLSYDNEMAREALIFIFNVSRMQTITERDSFSIRNGDMLRLVFNTWDYTITLDGTDIVPIDRTTAYEFTVTGDRAISLSAREREYDDVRVTVAISDLDGVILTRGSFDGEIVPSEELTAIGTKTYSYKDANDKAKTAELTIYETTVSEKYRQLFANEKEGYWFEACEVKDGNDVVSSAIATPESELNIVCHPIVEDTRMVIYISVDNINAEVGDIVVRDRNHHSYSLKAGYNEFAIDDSYSTPITVSGIGISENTSFAVYNNMTSVSKDSESGAFKCTLEGETLLHIFAGRPVPAQCAIRADISEEAEGAEVMIDRMHRLGAGISEQKTFKGCEIEVNPAGHSYLLDGTAPEFEGETHLFKATKDHVITISEESGIEGIEAEEAVYEDCETEYFNLQGQRISRPTAGTPIIIKRGSRIEKQIWH